MNSLEINLEDLSKFDLLNINGGTEPALGSYATGYIIGTIIRVAATTRIWVGIL